MSAKRRSRGFSLLEAVAALALLGLALPAILSVFTDAISRAASAGDRLDTLQRAQELVTLTTAQFHGEKTTRSGSDGAFDWDIEADFQDPHGGQYRRGSGDLVPVKLTVTVRSKRGAETRLDTLFLFHEASR